MSSILVARTGYAPLLIAGIVAFVLATVGMAFAPALAPVTEWLHGSFDANDAADQPGEDPVAAEKKCGECGEIESVQRVEPAGNSRATYEITVRLHDGSRHVNRDPSPANWRAGDRIKYIAGVNPSGNDNRR